MIGRIKLTYLITILLCTICRGSLTKIALTSIPEKQNFCVKERVYKSIGYSCVNMELKEIPQKLKADFEVSIFYISF